MLGRSSPHTNHHGHGHNARRMEKLEGVADKLTLVLVMVLGAAMAFGLMTSTGHVTW